LTFTVSPPRSGVSSTKLAPLPSECGRSVPVWLPDSEPLTVTPPSCAEEIACGIPGARVEVLAQAGHQAPLEQTETFNRLVTDFAGGLA